MLPQPPSLIGRLLRKAPRRVPDASASPATISRPGIARPTCRPNPLPRLCHDQRDPAGRGGRQRELEERELREKLARHRRPSCFERLSRYFDSRRLHDLLDEDFDRQLRHRALAAVVAAERGGVRATPVLGRITARSRTARLPTGRACPADDEWYRLAVPRVDLQRD
jgi:hypothetical protein